ncbi:MAG TPA: hypothetical protein VME23_14355 [Terracidiphilus sp.]|nr:hypothetical protein [Terracidiphilus sp.]
MCNFNRSAVYFILASTLVPNSGVCPRGFSQSPSQKACVVQDIDTPVMPACVVENRNGVLFIPAKYWMHPSFNRYGLSAFWINEFGGVYVNHSGRIVIRDVALVDNGPDNFHHGLVTIERDGKYGYADPKGRIVVPMKYSCAINFRDQYSDVGPLVCVGCRIERQGEYGECLDGQWFRTDEKGSLTPSKPPN